MLKAGVSEVETETETASEETGDPCAALLQEIVLVDCVSVHWESARKDEIE